MSGANSRAQIQLRTVTIVVFGIQLPEVRTSQRIGYLRSRILWQTFPCRVMFGCKIGVTNLALGAKDGKVESISRHIKKVPTEYMLPMG
jgi:hypothetical protein